MASIKDSVNLAEGETIIREYHAIDRPYIPIISRGVEGRIALTNKRAIGQTITSVLGGKFTEVTDAHLERIDGIWVNSGYSTSWKILIGGIAAIIVGISMLVDELWPIGIIALIAGVIAAIFAFRNGFGIGVRTAGGAGGGSPRSENYPLVAEVGFRVFKIHGPDADTIMKGLDTLILEIKARGAELLKDLKCPNPECSYMRAIDEKPPKHCPECGAKWGEA